MEKRVYAPSIDGIPGIMPGTVSLVPPPPQEIEEPQVTPHCRKTKKHDNAREAGSKPKYKNRMMPCNKKETD